MHVWISEYKKGGRAAVEFSDDGTQILGDLEGQMSLAAPVYAYLKVACDSTEDGYDRLLGALAWLKEEIKKRKENTTRAT